MASIQHLTETWKKTENWALRSDRNGEQETAESVAKISAWAEAMGLQDCLWEPWQETESFLEGETSRSGQ
jgi:hypothetical protein